MSRDLNEVRDSVLQKKIQEREFPGIAKDMSHVFAKQQESQCKASGRTVGDSFYRDSGGELKREALYFTYYKAYSESDH